MADENFEGNDNPEGGGDPSFMWSADLPGEGAAPEWFKGDKFQSVSAQAEAYGEAEKRIGQWGAIEKRFGGAEKASEMLESLGPPGEGGYQLDFSPEFVARMEEHGIELSADDPAMARVQEAAADLGLSDFAMAELSQAWLEAQMDARESEAEEVAASLGQAGGERLDKVSQWATNVFGENVNTALDMVQTVEQLEVFEKLMELQQDPTLPNPADHATPASTLAEMREGYERELARRDATGQRLASVDPLHKKKVDAMAAEIAAATNAGQ